MAAVHLHNALFTRASGSLADMNCSSCGSTIRSGGTSLDLLSTGQFVTPLNSPRKRTEEKRFLRPSRIWFYATLFLSVALLLWVTYCAVRYFIALRIYSGDIVRSRYALAMGITSIFSFLFFAMKCLSALRLSAGRVRRRVTLIFHSLAYSSSAIVLSLAIINLILVFRWRVPHSLDDSGRSVQGRCNWDVDVVWSGTGGACTAPDAMPFGDWLGAAISRLVVTIVLLAAYHLAIHGHLATIQSHETAPEMAFVEEGLSSTAVGPHSFKRVGEPQTQDSSLRSAQPAKESRPLSFTEAGQVLSRVEPEGDIEDEENEDEAVSESSSSSSSYQESTHDLNESQDITPSLNDTLTRSDSPETLPGGDLSRQPSQDSRQWYTGTETLPPNPPPSSFHRPIATSSNDLQDFASAFRSLVTRISRDTQEGLSLDSIPESPIVQRGNERVQVLGSYISRMSTIESIASREVANSSPSRSDTGPSMTCSPSSSHPGSRNLSRDPTINRPRDRERMTESPIPFSSEP